VTQLARLLFTQVHGKPQLQTCTVHGAPAKLVAYLTAYLKQHWKLTQQLHCSRQHIHIY